MFHRVFNTAERVIVDQVACGADDEEVPMFWSKISGEVRESAQPTMIATGCCACAVAARRDAFGSPLLTFWLTKRVLPS
ncbi:MAG: hypothetical protein H0U99_06895 [Chthoniobacterales bacterium]|nr:hypothetical protein [Chthoniobacterales bacterium]